MAHTWKASERTPHLPNHANTAMKARKARTHRVMSRTWLQQSILPGHALCPFINMGMSAYRTCTAHTLLQKRLPWYHRSCLTQSLNTYLLCCAFLQQLCQCPHDGPHTVSIQTTAQQLQQHLNATQLHKGTAPARTSSSTRCDLLCSLRSTSSGHSTAQHGKAFGR